MKRIFSLIFITSSLAAFSQQKVNCDTRLGQIPSQTIKVDESFSNEQDKNNYLLFTLDNGYFIRPIENITSSQKSQLLPIDGIVSNTGEAFDVELLSSPELFNFYTYNFERSETKTIGYDLGNGNALVFYSQQKLIEMYNQTTINK